jgi:hypothetical protein
MPAPTSPDIVEKILIDLSYGASFREVARSYGISKTTAVNIAKRNGVCRGQVLAACGTNAAYMRHKRHGERCTECWEAHAVATSYYKFKVKALEPDASLEQAITKLNELIAAHNRSVDHRSKNGKRKER